MCDYCMDIYDAHCWKCDLSLAATNRWCDDPAHVDGGQAYRDYLAEVRAGHIPATYIDPKSDPVLAAGLLQVEAWNRSVRNRPTLSMEPDGPDELGELDGCDFS